MEMTEILPGIYAVGTSLWIEERKILILGDVHMGYEEALSERGYLIPHVQFRESLKALDEIFNVVKPKTIVINGDLKHEFGQISDQEWLDTSKFFDILSEHCEKIILVRGNHDTVLGPIALKKKLNLVESYCFELTGGETVDKNGGKNIRGSLLQRTVKAFTSGRQIKTVCILHGDKIMENDAASEADLLIIGHDHPAVVLREGAKNEKYKCFLLGKWKKQRIIVMPSFLPTIEGTNIKQERLLSPYLDQDLDSFEAFIVGDKAYRFGKVKYI